MELKDISSVKVDKVVSDLEITFVGGLVMTLTVDESLGDSVSSGGSTLVVFNAERDSLIDPSGKTPAEKTTINMNNVLAIQERHRILNEATPEQKFDMAQLLKSLNDPIKN